ncbi:LacI family transcriptional regulator [Rhizobium aethiopicum]|uniref:LacI family transcriptional regulator n=1 Tax=Rhizobium aethiopicum TaxID=1138170 RepID=A0A1C3Y2A9_9HYPH|nr:LacI family DNA-binding transcriptional regulator [Rhizobium aethiopicum]SCB58604.1 LacI family transcriptional regulator [Rhizobium aethiopicum]
MKKMPENLRRATIHDVARAADVSIATVSRVLNKPERVNREMHDRVMAAASELGYTTNSAGKALKIARTRTIGTLLPRLDDPIFSEIAHGVQETLFAHDYVGFLQTSGYDNSQIFDAVFRLLNRGAEGVLVFGRIDDEKLLAFIKNNHVPILQIYSYLEGNPLPSVGIDNYASTQKIAQLMLQLGHREIAHISGPTKGNDRQQSRRRAYEDTMQANGLKTTMQMVQPGYTINDAGQAFRRILEENPKVTAVICATDLLACGVLAECRKLGIGVPNDISVSGFEDVAFASLLYQPLTTLAVPSGDMGRYAARAMIANLEEGQKLTSMQFETSLILRDSIARAPSGSNRAA